MGNFAGGECATLILLGDGRGVGALIHCIATTGAKGMINPVSGGVVANVKVWAKLRGGENRLVADQRVADGDRKEHAHRCDREDGQRYQAMPARERTIAGALYSLSR